MIMYIKKILIPLLIFAFIFIFPLTVSGQTTPDPGTTTPNPPIVKLENPIKGIDSIPGLIQTLLEGAIKIALPLIAIAIIFAGFQYVAARGNSEKISRAHQTLLWTLVGSAILLGSWALAKLIGATVTNLSS